MDRAVLAICDAERPAVIAGIMGAADVEVSTATTRVLLEAATFDGPTVLHAALRLGLRSESSARFEKGLPTELPPVAMAIALPAARRAVRRPAGAGHARRRRPRRRRRVPIALRHARLNAVLGLDIAPDESAAILRRLGCEVHEGPEAHRVIVPYTRRRDVAREIDLIEEVARIHGYGRIPAELPRMVGHGARTVAQRRTEQLRRYVADQGYSEIVSYRFVPAADVDRLQLADDDPRRRLVRLANPISEEMAVMRRSMLPGLLRAAAHNQRRQRTHGALFELGRTYGPAPDGRAEEREFLATLMFGAPTQEHWRAPLPHVDIHAAVGLAQALCEIAGVHPEIEPNQAPYFHPVRQARLVARDRIVGWAGEVHPGVLRNFDVAGPSAAVVIDLDALGAAAPTGVPQFEDLLTLPASTRDLALVVGDDVVGGDARRHGAPRRWTPGARGPGIRPLRGWADRRASGQPGDPAGHRRSHPDADR